MRKLLISAVVSFISLAAFNAQAHDYEGKGDWKSTTGTSGEYTAKLHIESNGDEMKFDNEITVNGEVHNCSYTTKKVGDSFFAVMVDGKQTGGGYCWDNGNAEAIRFCHLGYKDTEGNMVEETVHIGADKKVVHNMGSVWMPKDRTATTWFGAMSLVN